MASTPPLLSASSPVRWLVMAILGVVVYLDLATITRSGTTPTRRDLTSLPGFGTTEMLTAEAARVTIRLGELELPIPLPRPRDETLGDQGFTWIHRIYEATVPRPRDIQPLLHPIYKLRDEFPALAVHVEDRPQRLEIRLGISGLRTHTLRFQWLTRAPYVALVIAHLGADLLLIRDLLQSGFRLNFAVDPSLAFADVVAERTRLAGAETLVELHLPAEPEAQDRYTRTPANTLPPDIAALFAKLSAPSGILLFFHRPTDPEQVRRVDRALPAELPLVIVLPDDSDQPPPCAALHGAKRACVQADDGPAQKSDTSDIARTLERARIRARTTGTAIQVLYPAPNLVQTLRDELPRFAEAGVQLVGISSVASSGL